ncbi:MAG: helix-turn-helix transcriptional regulator, partial [Lachnospiraceae bacterium]|nr:helix-turn-helix transcriptional regulator [Lachnospiraceae bacterium]
MTKEEHIRSLFGDSARILNEDEDTMTLEINLTSYENGGDPLSRRPLSPAQVHLAEEISAYLSAHMDRHTTIKELGEIFHVSPTRVKTCIKNVYGMSVYAFARNRKMHAAARLLRQSDATVLEIAGYFGYDNGSKFAKAFRDVIGMTPAE